MVEALGRMVEPGRQIIAQHLGRAWGHIWGFSDVQHVCCELLGRNGFDDFVGKKGVPWGRGSCCLNPSR